MKNDDAYLVCQLSGLANSKTNFIVHLYLRNGIECRNGIKCKIILLVDLASFLYMRLSVAEITCMQEKRQELFTLFFINYSCLLIPHNTQLASSFLFWLYGKTV